jgi:small subunit ribosomal protein S20
VVFACVRNSPLGRVVRNACFNPTASPSGEFEHVPKPNTKRGQSAVRSLRQSRIRALRNQSVKSAIKTFVKKTRVAITNGEEQAATFLQQTSSLVDKAAKRGIIHKNAAARRKSRLAKRLNETKAAASTE